MSLGSLTFAPLWSATLFAPLLLLVAVVPSACSVQPKPATAEDADCVSCDSAHAAVVGNRVTPPPPLREKLGAHLLALSTSYTDGGLQAVQTYANSAGLDLTEQRVSVQVLAVSQQDVLLLEQRIEEAGGSVQTTFENSIFATLPVPVLGAFASGEEVWRMDMQQRSAPTGVIDLETEHGGHDAK